MKINYFFFLVLTFFILFSKEILVFNEEILILFCFTIFIYLCYNFLGNSIYHELKERNHNIEKNFNDFDKTHKDVVLSLIFYYKSQQNLIIDIKNIILFLENIIHLFFDKFLILLNKILFQFIDNNLKRFLSFEKKIKSDLHFKFINFILNSIHFKFFINKKNIDNKLFIKNSISFIIKK